MNSSLAAKKAVFSFVAISAFSLVAQPVQANLININYTWTGTESVQGVRRLTRDDSPSVAGVSKPFPGVSANNPTYFYETVFSALPGSVVSVVQNSGNSLDSFSALYDGSVAFNPSSLSTGYLGDAGASGPSLYSITVPSSAAIRFVGNSVFETDSIGKPLDVTITYTPVPGPLPVLGAASAWAYSRRLRRRCKAATL
ncbi:MAG: hypothetical protein VKN56_01875 [Cyanobacteriota bacterium]|nr:hypothetical protein [Cyanobacteriota bacterium]